jgi:hypothetical protein
MDISCDFQPRQIVCLEHQATHLYAEVIQVVKSRQIGWLRPLLLAEFSPSDRSLESPLLCDLRPSADLLWPLALFRPALDTEVMPLLVQLLTSEPPLDPDPVAFTRLQQFIHQAWQGQRNKSRDEG